MTTWTLTQNFLTDRNTPMMNDNAIANIIVDLDFIEEQFRGAGRANLGSHFAEMRLVSCRAWITLALDSYFQSFIFFFALARRWDTT
jgi:hypothetical protein